MSDGEPEDGMDANPVREADIPDSHPLADRGHLLDTHAGHLQAYSGVLDDADPDAVDAAMVILSSEDATDTLPTVAPGTDAEWLSFVMLAAHLGHVADSFGASPVDVAKHAVHVLYQNGDGGEVYD